MYLKALEIQGFKSFPEKTRLSFDKDVTAIVGPNGSGKSNISDAILWVMGEQSSKALRGGKMEDVIFGGTEKRRAMGYAQVSLVLDNTKRIFSLDSDEVTLTRRYYRSGESEYYVNRESVRLKDVNELLMDTGLGRDGYSIIGQGRISEIVSARSRDRRDVFEEAAGISRFRYRKEESERKLARTEENLLRVGDKIEELELQVLPLKEQAETAKRFLLLRDELRALEIDLWMDGLDKVRDKAENARADYEAAKSQLDAAHAELDGLYETSEQISQRMREKDMEAEAARGDLTGAESLLAECTSLAAVLRTNIQHNAESLDRQKAELAEQSGRESSLEDSIAEKNTRITEIDTQHATLETQLRSVGAKAAENESGEAGLRQRLSELIARESELSEALASGRSTVALLDEQHPELLARAASLEKDAAAAQESIGALSAALREDRGLLGEAQEKHDSLTNVIAGFEMRLRARETETSQLTEKYNSVTVECRTLDGRIGMLSEMEREFEGFGRAVKTVMQESGRGALRGIHGPAVNLLRAEPDVALAIETALGAAAQNIVVDTPEQGKTAIEYLKRRDAGRATFLPMSSVKGAALRNLPRSEPGFVGLASELVSFDAAYSGIFESLLGRTVIVETLGDAVRISKKNGGSFRIVSLDGQVVNAGGSMTGGSAARGTGAISRANELEKLRRDRTALEASCTSVAAALETSRRELGAVKYELETARGELTAAAEELHRRQAQTQQRELLLNAATERRDSLEDERESALRQAKENRRRAEETLKAAEQLERQLEKTSAASAELTAGSQELQERRREITESLSELRSSIASLDAERSAAVDSVRQLSSLKGDLSAGRDSRLASIAELSATAEILSAQLAEREQRRGELEARCGEFKARIAAINAEKLQLEGRRTQTDRAAQDKNRALMDMERSCARIEQKKLASEMEEQQIIDKLWDSYELSRSAAMALRRPVESVPKATRRVSELKKEISSLGTPNLGAIDEYERVRERYEFLTGQREDVEKSRTELLGIIDDITGEMKEIFVREFRAIDAQFRKTFAELFGGGKASLELEDENDVLECGIEIRVQPPGKAVSTISLLSGGEMSFVAIALYFAILRVRPTPFCVMDEIESALDEVNVTRYAEYMRGMCAETQFIVISHRRGTMELADMLYGVTMQEKGVSTVLSVNLDEAERTAQEQ